MGSNCEKEGGQGVVLVEGVCGCILFFVATHLRVCVYSRVCSIVWGVLSLMRMNTGAATGIAAEILRQRRLAVGELKRASRKSMENSKFASASASLSSQAHGGMNAELRAVSGAKVALASARKAEQSGVGIHRALRRVKLADSKLGKAVQQDEERQQAYMEVSRHEHAKL